MESIMAKANTNIIALIIADDRGFVTRKQCRTQMREALKGLGLTCGLMESEGGKRFTATITNSDVTVTAERKVGAAVVANATKKALKALAVEREVTEIIENDPLDLLGSSDEPEIVIEPRIKIAKGVLLLKDFALESMDEQGRLTSAHPRKGGLSAGAIRGMLEADGYEVAPNMRKADLIDQLMAVVSGGGVVAPVAEKPVTKAKPAAKKVLKFEQGAASTEIVF
jgi:hypothetical protein